MSRLAARLLALATLPFLGMFGAAVAAEEAQPPGVVETWACSYKPGKDIDDLMDARDYYVRQADKAGLSIGPAYLWSLYKGDVDFDLLWLAPHPNYGAFAAAADAEAASEDMAGVVPRFDTVVDCTARLGSIQSAFQREGAQDDGDGMAVISSNACRLNAGVGPDQLGDFRRHIDGVLSDLGENTPNSVYTISPTTGGTNTPDFVLFTVNDSLTAYGNFIGNVQSNPAGQQLGRHFQMLGDCNLAMWNSQQVIAAPEGDG